MREWIKSKIVSSLWLGWKYLIYTQNKVLKKKRPNENWMEGKPVTISTITLFRQHKTNWRKMRIRIRKSKMQMLCYTDGRGRVLFYAYVSLHVNSSDFGGKRLTNEWIDEETLIESPHLKFKWTSTDAFESTFSCWRILSHKPYYPVFTYDVAGGRACSLFLFLVCVCVWATYESDFIKL